MRKFQKSYELYDYNLLFIRRLADVCGLDVMAKNYSFNMRFLVCICLLLMAICSVIHSFIFYFHNWYKILELVIIVSLMMQASVKIYVAFIHRHFYTVMYDRLRDFHYKYRNHQNAAQLMVVMERIHFTTKIFFALYIVTGCTFSIYPVVTYVIEGRRELLVCFRIPWVDTDELEGYLITVCFQAALLLLSVLGFTAADSVILLFVFSLIAIVDVFTYSLGEINVLLNENPRNVYLIRKKVREAYLYQLEIIEYETDLDERYFVSYFIQMIAVIMGISVTLFLIYGANYIPGYALLLPLFGQLLEMCLLGTVLTVQNEEITRAIYDTHWYLLEKSEKKSFALMLLRSHNFVEMTIGGLKPLNIETFVEIMKSIYSYFMMMVSFVE